MNEQDNIAAVPLSSEVVFSKIEMGDLLTALSELQGEMEAVSKSDHGHRHNYASIDSVLRMVRPLLAKHGLSVQQHTHTDSHGVTRLMSILGHKSGQWIYSSTALIYDPQDIQSLGGAITYVRRYALVGILGIQQQDDDGNPPARQEKPKAEAKAYIRADQVNELEELIGGDTEILDVILKATKVNDLSKMSEKQFYWVKQNFFS